MNILRRAQFTYNQREIDNYYDRISRIKMNISIEIDIHNTYVHYKSNKADKRLKEVKRMYEKYIKHTN